MQIINLGFFTHMFRTPYDGITLCVHLFVSSSYFIFEITIY